jgi:hypothetical protein
MIRELLNAQENANILFKEIEKRNYITAGQTEKDIGFMRFISLIKQIELVVFLNNL